MLVILHGSNLEYPLKIIASHKYNDYIREILFRGNTVDIQFLDLIMHTILCSECNPFRPIEITRLLG